MGGRDVFQKPAEPYEARGRLDPQGFDQHVEFRTLDPAADLQPFVEHFWSLRWDREGEPAYVSEQVMHRPYVDVFVSREESGVQSTFRGRRDYVASGTGRIVGVRFRPGSFRAFWAGKLSTLLDRNLGLAEVFPEVGAGFMEAVLAGDDLAAFDRIQGLLRARHPIPDPHVQTIADIIAFVEASGPATVGEVAKQFSRSERWLQDLCSRYLGVGIKWLLLRRKLLQAAERIRAEDHPDGAALAYDLGYSSQQHFITDFRRVLGKTPLQYKRSLNQR